MTIKRITAVVAASAVASLSLSSFALADSVSVGDTGPNSSNVVTIDNNTNVTETNNNNVTVVNTTVQTATSGDANVSGNTNGGSASTGSVSNDSTTTTAIGIGNSAPVVLGGMGGAGGTGDGSGAGATGGSGSLPATGAGSVSSSSLGSAGGLLPKTGPQDNLDVSALRDAVLPVASATPELVKKTNTLSTELLIAAAILSLIGAVGSALYVSKREKKLA